MPLKTVEETAEELADTSATADPPQEADLSSSTSQSTEESSADSSSEIAFEDREPGIALPSEILAILSVLLGESISDLSPTQLEDIVADFGERIAKLLSVAAVIMKVPLADQNPVYQEIISQFSNNESEN